MALLTISPATILADYIIDELDLMIRPDESGVWPLFISGMPDADEVDTNCGAIYDTSGTLDLRQMNGYTPSHPGIQIKIRSQDYNTGYAKLEEVVDALSTVNRVLTIIGTQTFMVYNVKRTTPIVALGKEPGTKRRYLFTVNFLVTLKNVT